MLSAIGLLFLNLCVMEALGAPLLDFLEEAFATDAAPSAPRLLLVFVLADVAGYAVHRAMHRVPFLWRFHAVHHAPTHLT